VWGDRVNEVDLRIAKILRFNRTRTNVGIDVYNLFNSDAILTYNQTYSPSVAAGPGGWLQPTSVLTPRFIKFSAQFDF
jgi:outer membrane receptor protein involved in Fe transport